MPDTGGPDRTTPGTERAVRPRGPRRAGADTRADIVEAARRLFASHGYAGTSLRAVAREAGVDAALVHHYFDGKSDLFSRSIGLDLEAGVVVGRILEQGREAAPVALVAAFLAVWEQESAREQLLGVVSNLVARPEAAAAWREYVTGTILVPVTQALGVEDPERRAALVASQLIGLAMARYVVRLAPLADAPVEAVVADVAPTLRRYLYGDLDTPPTR